MSIDELKKKNLILFECISGSKAYGTDLPTSDTDIRGVFVLPQDDFYGLEYIEQVNDETNDVVYYELKRFIELLYRNNPNILEILNMPDDCVLYKHPVFEQIQPQMFLSKLCKATFAGYARTQIGKARGLNKKIINPVAPERKDVLDFCFITAGIGSVSAREWLSTHQLQAKYCGLVNVPHIKNLYALFYDHQAEQTQGQQTLGFAGVYKQENSNDVALSSIPTGMELAAYLSFNKDGYSTYCKVYKEYWDWVEKRNEERYQNTLQHGKNYDAKNMMHTIRLLDMAAEIAVHKKVIVRRPNRDLLMRIRSGEFSYEALLDLSEEKLAEMDTLYEQSGLPKQPDYLEVKSLLVKLRRNLYKNT